MPANKHLPSVQAMFVGVALLRGVVRNLGAVRDLPAYTNSFM